jgi:glycine cleavage system H protein
MVVLLVLATFVVFITVDVILHREKYKFRVAAPAVSQPVSEPVVAGVSVPEILSYHPGHTWALDQGNGRIRMGLDEFAASLIGRAEHVETPQRGRWLRQGEKGWTFFTDRGEVNMLAPAEGEIVALNDKALADPDAIRKDPYRAGWLMEVWSPDAQVSFRNLLSGGVARRWMEESMSELRQALAPAAMATALDGGRISPEVGVELPPERWRELTRRFFRS